MAKTAIIHFDGMCEPRNPGGWMGAGWVVRWIDDEGNEHHFTGSQVWGPSESNTNNIAEWRALRLALDDLHEKVGYIRMLTVYGDSQLVVNQLNGDWQCRKAHLEALRDQCWAKLGQMAGVWKAVWVRRENNVEADTLSRRDYAKTALNA